MGRSKKAKRESGKRAAKKVPKSARYSKRRTVPNRPSKLAIKGTASAPVRRATAEPQLVTPQAHRVFHIELDSISGETTIGDLIVAFPRTRDVLLKRGLRFDVEQAGYLYMTLNVFSAMHGFEPGNLIRELQSTLREPSPQTLAQTPRQMATAPTA